MRRPLAGPDGDVDPQYPPPTRHGLSRRAILGSLAGIAGAAALTACGGSAAVTASTAAASAATSASPASGTSNASSASTTVAASTGTSVSSGGSTSAAQSSASQAASSSASQAANGAQPVTLTWLAGRSAQEAPIWQAMADAFNKANGTVKVNFVNDPAGWQPKLAALMAAGTGPDIVRLESNGFTDLVRKSFFIPLDPYIATAGAALDLPDFFPQALTAFKVQGKQYAMPMVLSCLVMNYNTRLVQEAGLAAPAAGWTWNDYLQWSQHLTKASGSGTDQWGTTFETSSILRSIAFIWQNGGDLFNQTFSQATFTAAPTVGAYNFLTDMLYKYHVAPTKKDLADAKQSMAQLFVNEKIASYIVGPWDRDIFNQGKNLTWDAAPLPKGAASDTTPLFVGGYPITTQSKQPADAWTLAQFLTGKDSSLAWAKVGTSSPARQSAASSPAFLTDAGPPKNSKAVYVEYRAKSGRPSPDFAGYSDVSSALEKAVAPMWDGTVTPQEALAKAEPSVNALLQKDSGQ
jgi:multiple sugar transport system substrate-binding protein